MKKGEWDNQQRASASGNRIVLYFDCLRYTLGIIPFFLDNALNLGGQ